jgi:hypothetical protein
MSTISTFYDEFNALLVSKFGSTHQKLDNPYFPEDNNDLILKRGYGFSPTNGSNPKRLLDCFTSMTREITVTQTIINRGTERDTTIRETAEKQLLEDHRVLVNAVLSDTNLNETLARLEYVGDNGIEFIFGEKNNFLMIRSTYLIEYLEEVTT